ncbi:MAG: hypothetical protein JSU98_13425 [Gemmatimonadales bacterium]|nr:MAG: hypothetical protein JSU98_13425 [Gemmatimonadales bacterium]
MISGHRTYLRVGGVWLLLAALGHTVGHWLTFVTFRTLDEAHQAPVEDLVSTPAGAEIWALFNQFSLAFALFLLLSGTASVIASRKSVPVREACHWSGFAGAFWMLAFVVFLLEPAAPGLIIAGTAAFFHVAAFLAALSPDGPVGPAWEAAVGGETGRESRHT